MSHAGTWDNAASHSRRPLWSGLGTEHRTASRYGERQSGGVFSLYKANVMRGRLSVPPRITCPRRNHPKPTGELISVRLGRTVPQRMKLCAFYHGPTREAGCRNPFCCAAPVTRCWRTGGRDGFEVASRRGCGMPFPRGSEIPSANVSGGSRRKSPWL